MTKIVFFLLFFLYPNRLFSHLLIKKINFTTLSIYLFDLSRTLVLFLLILNTKIQTTEIHSLQTLENPNNVLIEEMKKKS